MYNDYFFINKTIENTFLLSDTWTSLGEDDHDYAYQWNDGCVTSKLDLEVNSSHRILRRIRVSLKWPDERIWKIKKDPAIFKPNHLPWPFGLNQKVISCMIVDWRDLSCAYNIKIDHNES